MNTYKAWKYALERIEKGWKIPWIKAGLIFHELATIETASAIVKEAAASRREVF